MPRTALARFIAVSLLLGLLGIATAAAGDLDANQRSALTALEAHAKQIETNVGLAVEAAGPGQGRPPEAKARLARSRLASPISLLPQVRAALVALPADHPDVAALRKRLEDVASRIAALTERIDGGATPPPGPGAGGGRLDYRQQKTLDDAEYYVREVEGLASAASAVAKEVATLAEPATFDHRRAADAMATIEKAVARGGLARTRLDALPAEGTGVRGVVDRLAVALVAVEAARTTIAPLHERLRRIVDPANWPTLDADVRRAQDLSQMLAEPRRAFDADPMRATALVAVLTETRQELVRYRAHYAALVAQQTDAGRRVEGAGKFLESNLDAFMEAAKGRRSSLPAEIDEAIADVARMSDEAVAGRKPAFFVHAIPDRVDRLEAWVGLLAALDAEAGKAAAERVAALRVALNRTRSSLRDAIVDAAQLPPDAYAGDDRVAVERDATAAWKAKQPTAQVLGVRIPSKQWHRESMWRRQNSTWYLVDRSKLQAQLLVRHDGGLVVVRPIDLWIDHVDSDARSAVPMDDPADEIPPQRLLRAERLK